MAKNSMVLTRGVLYTVFHVIFLAQCRVLATKKESCYCALEAMEASQILNFSPAEKQIFKGASF